MNGNTYPDKNMFIPFFILEHIKLACGNAKPGRNKYPPENGEMPSKSHLRGVSMNTDNDVMALRASNENMKNLVDLARMKHEREMAMQNPGRHVIIIYFLIYLPIPS